MLRRTPKLTYVRLNPPGGLDTIDLADVTRGADIEAITNQYLEIPEVTELVLNIAETIVVSSPAPPIVE
jgi:hypothetical protein